MVKAAATATGGRGGAGGRAGADGGALGGRGGGLGGECASSSFSPTPGTHRGRRRQRRRRADAAAGSRRPRGGGSGRRRQLTLADGAVDAVNLHAETVTTAASVVRAEALNLATPSTGQAPGRASADARAAAPDG